jgi:S1-C subfamily serine protease
VLGLSARRWPTSGLAFRQDGIFLAASHAVEREEQITVRLPDGTESPATLLGRDGSLDLAVLKAGASLEPGSWAPPNELEVGQFVVGLYRPDTGVRARLGMVEGLGPGFHTRWGGRVDAELDVDISVRNLSAMGLANAKGQLLGFYVAGSRGRGLLLPRVTLERVVEQIVRHGRVKRGYLGVGTQPIRLPEAAQGLAEAQSGLLVLAVEKGSPAEAAGLVLGDVLVQLDGRTVGDVEDLWAFLGEDAVGQAKTAKVLRAGKVVEVNLTIGQRP